MGLFGSKKTYVASTLSNLAGPIEDRPNYLRLTVATNVLSGSQKSMGDTIKESYLRGPGIKLRSFFKWATDNYDLVGIPRERFGSDTSINISVIEDQIDSSEYAVDVQTASSGLADYAFWAEQWMLVNYRELFETEWESDFNEVTGDIDITFEDGGSASFTPANFNPSARYLYAYYVRSIQNEEGPVETGATIPLGSDPFPSTSGWTTENLNTINTPIDLDTVTRVEVAYSDDRPDEDNTTTSTRSESYSEIHNVYSKSEYEGGDPDVDRVFKIEKTMYHDQIGEIEIETTEQTTSVEIEDGVIKTTKTTVNKEVVKLVRSYRIDEQEVTIKEWDGPYIYIYRFGSGNLILDSMIETSAPLEAEYFPSIPIRVDNKFITQLGNPTAFELSKKAFRKSVTGNIDELIDDLSDEENLGDMDYIYGTFGIPINTLENAGRKYIYDYFLRLAFYRPSGSSEYDAWASSRAAYNAQFDIWLEWKMAQDDPSNSLFGTVEPTKPTLPNLGKRQVRVTSTGAYGKNLDMEISWNSIREVTGSGLGKPGAKVGDCWFDLNGVDEFDQSGSFGKWAIFFDAIMVDKVRLYRQIAPNIWTALDLVGFKHRNYVYGGKYVDISMKEGLEDAEESGFLVPLHYPTLKEMSLVDSTQLSTACCFLVFNSYLVKKTGLFASLLKIFIVVLTIAIVVFVPTLAPALTSAALATGTAIGLTGITALLVGATINVIAGMIISSLIMQASIEIFGEKIGAVLGVIFSAVAMNGFNNFLLTQSVSLNFGNLLSVVNIIQLTSVVGNAVSNYMQADAAGIVKRTQDLVEDYEKESKRIAEKYADEFGYGLGTINPLILTDAANDPLGESPSSFLSRTLMTGSDIAQMSMDMLTHYSELTLSTDLVYD